MKMWRTMSSQPLRQRSGITMFLLAAMAVGAMLRWHELDASLWLDEVFTHEGASRSIFYAWSHRAYPLYYVLANLALRFDDSEIALRFPSFLAGILTIPAVYLLASRAGGRAAGIVAVLLMTFNAYHIRYSQEARFYALVMLGSILMVWTLHRALTRGEARNWIGYAVTGFFSLIAQLSVIPYFLTLAGTAALWLAGAGVTKGRQWPWRKFACFSLATVCAISGLAIATTTDRSFSIDMFSLEAEEMADENEEGISSYSFRLTLPQYAGYIGDFAPVEPGPFRYGLVLFAVVGFGALVARDRCLAAIVAAQFLIPPIPFFIMHSSHWYASRYFCSVLPLYVLLIALGMVTTAVFVARTLRQQPYRQQRSETGELAKSPVAQRLSRASLIVLTAFLLALSPAHALAIADHYEKRPISDWKQLANYIAQRFQLDTSIVLFTPRSADGRAKPAGVFSIPLHFYLQRSLPNYFPENHHAVLGTLRYVEADTPQELRLRITDETNPAAWAVVRRKRDLPKGCDRVIGEYAVEPWRRFGRLMLRHTLSQPT
ncbi:MAG: hypothetical protein AMXMBFR82_35870 [Candidatus Hydrogenedentota bacterium]